MHIYNLINGMKSKGKHLIPYFGEYNFSFSQDGNNLEVRFNGEDFENNFEKGYKKLIEGFLKINDFEKDFIENNLEEIYKNSLNFKNDFLIREPFKKWTKRSKQILERKENLKKWTPTLENLTEDYFGKKFIKQNMGEYKIKPDILYSAIIDPFGNIILRNDEKNFDKKNLSGKGIFNIFHEHAHIYQKQKFGKDFQDLNLEFIEAHSELSAYEISNQSKNILLNDAKIYAKKNNEEFLFNSPEKEFASEYKILMKEKDLEKRLEIIGLNSNL